MQHLVQGVLKEKLGWLGSHMSMSFLFSSADGKSSNHMNKIARKGIPPKP